MRPTAFIGAAVAALSLLLLAGCAPSLTQQQGGQNQEIQALVWNLRKGQTITINAQQQAVFMGPTQSSSEEQQTSQVTATLTLTVISVDKAGNATAKVAVSNLNGSDSSGDQYSGMAVTPYLVVIAPDGQVLKGEIWPTLGTTGTLPAMDAFTALRQGMTLPANVNSWAVKGDRAYDGGKGAMSGKGKSVVNGRSGGNTNVTTTLSYPLQYQSLDGNVEYKGSDTQVIQTAFDTNDYGPETTQVYSSCSVVYTEKGSPTTYKEQATATTILTLAS
ncbi:MAG TPA: hypothetical protein VIA06_07920 [Candidatus Dormibacteraeota bacterium]|jgi:hypothetical protein|nr:hypothetical protein [Candidatus Dormibacteraeota bacterium]